MMGPKDQVSQGALWRRSTAKLCLLGGSLWSLLVILTACVSVPPPTAPLPPLPIDLTLPRSGGGTISLASLRGRPVILNFFATWSLPSMAEIPLLISLSQRYPQIHVVGVAMDLEGEKLVEPYVRELDIPYPVAGASQALVEGRTPLGRIQVIPQTLVLDRQGKVIQRLMGVQTAASLERAFRDAL